MPIDVSVLPTWALIGLCIVAGGLVWSAGDRLTRNVNALSQKTGIGRAFAGMLLLGGITSLPEVATVSTASALGNAPMAVNNLLGTASVNVLLLAIADIIYGRNALTAVAAKPATLMQGILSILLMIAVAVFATLGDVAIVGVGLGTTALLLATVFALRLMSAFEQRHVWQIVDQDKGAGEGEETAGGLLALQKPNEKPLEMRRSRNELVMRIAAAGALILVGGYFLSSSADALADRTGIGASMIGFTLLALATSLPELSSITTALRLRQYEMAVGDIFGTNMFNVALLFLADAVYVGGPVLDLAGPFEVTGALLAALMSSVFLVGLLARRNATLFRMGYDSAAAILLFAGGLAALSRIGG